MFYNILLSFFRDILESKDHLDQRETEYDLSLLFAKKFSILCLFLHHHKHPSLINVCVFRVHPEWGGHKVTQAFQDQRWDAKETFLPITFPHPNANAGHNPASAYFAIHWRVVTIPVCWYSRTDVKRHSHVHCVILYLNSREIGENEDLKERRVKRFVLSCCIHLCKAKQMCVCISSHKNLWVTYSLSRPLWVYAWWDWVELLFHHTYRETFV